MVTTMCLDAPRVAADPLRVRVTKFTPDDNDLPGTTSVRAEADIRANPSGSWYWNPRFTVHCPSPTCSFFRTARCCQKEMVRIDGQSLRGVEQSPH